MVYLSSKVKSLDSAPSLKMLFEAKLLCTSDEGTVCESVLPVWRGEDSEVNWPEQRSSNSSMLVSDCVTVETGLNMELLSREAAENHQQQT